MKRIDEKWMAIALFVLAGYVSWPGSAPSASSMGELVLVFSAQRRLVMEAMGCSIYPAGGAHRESTFVKELRGEGGGEPFLLSGGTAFLPFDLGDGARPPEPGDRAKLVENWNHLGLKALHPSSEDLTIGLADLRKLRDRARFPFIATNLVDDEGEPILDPHLLASPSGRPVLVLGVMGPSSSAVPAGARITDPIAAVADVIRRHGTGRMVIVLSSLRGESEAAFLDKVSGIHVVLSGGEGLGGYSTSGLVRSPLLFGRPDFGGRQLFVARIPPGSGLGEAFNLEVSDRVRRTLGRWNEELNASRALFARARGRERRRIGHEIAELREFIGRYSERDLTPATGSLTYNGRYYLLDASYE